MTVGLRRPLNPRLGPFETQVDQSGVPRDRRWSHLEERAFGPALGEDSPGSSEPGVAGVSQSGHVLSVGDMGLCLPGPGDRTSLLLILLSGGTLMARVSGQDRPCESCASTNFIEYISLVSQENEMNFG